MLRFLQSVHWEPARPLQRSLVPPGPKVSGECFWSIPGLFGDFWGPGAGGPGRHFRDFFGISGPEGPRDLCKGRAGSQSVHVCKPRFELIQARISGIKWLLEGVRWPHFLPIPKTRFLWIPCVSLAWHNLSLPTESFLLCLKLR